MTRFPHPMPTLEHARSCVHVSTAPRWMFWRRANLLKRQPVSEQRLAALWLDARLLIRSTRYSDEHVGPRTFKGLRRAEAEPNSEGMGEGDSRYVAKVIEEATSCSFCSMSPGRTFCSACGGEGFYEQAQTNASGNTHTVRVQCSGCGGAGTVECGACDGTATTHRVEIAWVEDDWKTIRYAYPPKLSFAVESKIREYMEAVEVWPEALAMPLEEQLISGPYRSAPSNIEEFQGFVVDGPIDEARAMVDAIRGSGRVLRAVVSAHVLPLLCLRYPQASIVVHTGTDGEPATIVERD